MEDEPTVNEILDALDAMVGRAPADGVYVACHCGGYVEEDYRTNEPWRPCPLHGVPTAWTRG
ncbi:MAG: hypothetical protein DMD91_27855 [Candidatus Rokuibacteriota bacterium]|nr:MAG: hypothetical protein DMD91_27855 [Candidatus Rokubacteria bacterium]